MTQPSKSTAVRDHLWIGNLPYETTEEELWQLCGTIGSVESIELHREPKTGRSLGWVFCRFTDLESSIVAKEMLSGISYGGRTLAVEWAASRMTHGLEKTRRGDHPPETPQSRDLRMPQSPEGRLELQREIANLSMDALEEMVVDIETTLTRQPAESGSIVRDNKAGWEAFLKTKQLLQSLSQPQDN